MKVEGTQISKQGVGYPSTPGIHTDEQVESWKKVTKAVHKAGGDIFFPSWKRRKWKQSNNV